jgi:thioredoxin 2
MKHAGGLKDAAAAWLDAAGAWLRNFRHEESLSWIFPRAKEKKLMSVVACAKCGAKNRVDERAAAARRAVCGKCGTPLKTTAGGTKAKTAQPLTVTDSTFELEVLRAGAIPVLLDCWAPWCGPCRIIAPVLDQLAAEAGGQYRIAKLNVDENPQTAAQFSVQSIPTMLVFKNGALVDRFVGVQPKEVLAARLASLT